MQMRVTAAAVGVIVVVVLIHMHVGCMLAPSNISIDCFARLAIGC